MKWTKHFLYSIILLAFIGQALFSQDDIIDEEAAEDEDKVPRTILVLPFYNQTPDMKEFEYLTEVLRDSLISKLQTSDQFYFIDYIDIKNKVKEMAAKMKKSRKGSDFDHFEEPSMAIKLASELKADIVIIGKYVILEEKVMMYCRAYDILESQDAVSSVDGDSGIDIFVLVDALTNDMARKMAEKYPKMTGHESSSHVFTAAYSGVALGDEYEKVLELVKNSRYGRLIYPKKNMIIVKGHLNSAFKTTMTVLNFSEDNKLTNIWLLVKEVPQADRKVYAVEYRNKMRRIFGDGYEEREGDEYFWQGDPHSFELINRLFYKNQVSYILHFFENNKKVEFDDIEEYFSYFEKGYDFTFGVGFFVSMGGKVSGHTEIANENETVTDINSQYFGVSKEYERTQLTADFVLMGGAVLPISFNYYPSSKFSTGFITRAGYLPSLVAIRSGGAIMMHTIHMSLAMKHKLLMKRDKYKRLIFEYGVPLFVQIIPNQYVVNYSNVDGVRTAVYSDSQPLVGDLFISAGLMFGTGIEQRIKSFSMEHVVSTGVTIGGQSLRNYTLESIYSPAQKDDRNLTFQSGDFIGGIDVNFFFAYELRLNYYFFKKLK